MRGDFFLDLAELIHERLVNLQAAGRIDDDKIVAVILGAAHRLPADLHRFFFRAALKHRHAHARAQHLKLFDSGRTVHVGGHKQRPVALALEHEGKLGAVRRLAGALQAAQHDDGRRRRGRSEAGFPAAHEGGELLIDNLHHHLRRREAFHDLSPDGAFAHARGELFRHFIVDVGFQKSQADFAHRFLDVAFAQLSL